MPRGIERKKNLLYMHTDVKKTGLAVFTPSNNDPQL